MNWQHILFVCELYIILSLSVNLISGYAGLLSFSNAAFYGIGAYATAILMKNLQLNFFAALAGAAVLNAIFSLGISYFATRLKGLYFTLATISFQVIVFSVLYNWETLTGGSYGLMDIPGVRLFGYTLSGTRDFLLLGGAFTLLILFFFLYLKKTPFIRLLECIRDNEVCAVSLGRNINHYKFICNAVAAVFITMAGALYAAYNGYLDPTNFSLDESILILSMILIGGTGNLKGPIVGAVFYVLLPELLRLVPVSTASGASLQMAVYGLILILVVRFRPNGFLGKFRFSN